MDIYTILLSKTHNPHYLNRYVSFVSKFSQSLKIKYKTEMHHIIPKSLYPEYANLKINSWNKVHLTYRQHFIAHWLLWKSFPSDPKLAYAFWAMHSQKNNNQNRNSYTNSKTYNILKTQALTFISISATGRKLTTEQKEMLKIKRNTDEYKILNSWSQLKKNQKYVRFASYKDFEQSVIDAYHVCSKIPSLISIKLDVTIDPIITILKRNNLNFISDGKYTKLVINYGARWQSYEEYQSEIISLHNNGLGTCQIANILKVNDFGVTQALKRANITPHKITPGPKTKNSL